MKYTKLLSIVLSLVITLCTVLTSCSTAVDTDGYTVINSTASDASGIASALNADYKLVESSASLGTSGRNIVVCVSEDGVPFDLSTFNDEGYIIRRVDDDIIICAKNESACTLAVDYFKKQYIISGRLVFAKDLDYVHGAADRLGDVTIGGVNIEEFQIVIPEVSTEFERYAAEIFNEHLFDAGGISLEVVKDTAAEAEHEIIIGNTSRSESPDERDYSITEYYFEITENDIVVDGLNYMVGGGIGKLIGDYLEPEDCGDVAIDGVLEGAVYEYEPREAKSAILVISDGFGFNHVNMARAEKYIDEFYPEYLPVQGACLTYSEDVTVGTEEYTDSAAAATALACGFKTYNGAIGVDFTRDFIPNVRELAESVDARTAVITTDTLDGATPASFLAHAYSRNDTSDIEAWYDKITVEYARANLGWGLKDNTKAALHTIAEGGDQFFIMIEEAYTDKDAHANNLEGTCDAVIRLNEMVAYTMAYVACHTDTVLLITADHETGGITKNRRGNYYFTTGSHTNTDVPMYAMGDGTEFFNNATRDNITVASFIAKIFGDDDFGHLAHSVK